jgi:ribose 5-phosphate isomerase RpiB
MKIVVGSDHARFSLKQEIVKRFSHLGHALRPPAKQTEAD